jgi:hypothetical protein
MLIIVAPQWANPTAISLPSTYTPQPEHWHRYFALELAAAIISTKNS